MEIIIQQIIFIGHGQWKQDKLYPCCYAIDLLFCVNCLHCTRNPLY